MITKKKKKEKKRKNKEVTKGQILINPIGILAIESCLPPISLLISEQQRLAYL